MKKSLQFIAVLVVSLCFTTSVHAATKQELIDYADLMRKEERYYANLIRKAAGNFNE